MNLFERLMQPELRRNPEYQSALVRLGIWIFSVVYIGSGALTGYYQVNLAYYAVLFTLFLAAFLGLAISVALRPDWPPRRFLSLGADVAATSLAIFLTREAISPFYLLYIWIFISYGTRYGPTHLKVASVLSLIAYNTVLLALDEWQKHTFEAVFFLLLLGILPVYQYSLLRKVHLARQEAERANRAKGDFLATMTHELRTPLSSVIGMSRLLEATRLSEDQRDYVQSIASSARLLMALIGDVLDLSKVEAGKLCLESAAFDLRQTLLEVCVACESQALDKGLEVICRVEPELPAEVQGDDLRLRQILYNLLGNAIKFTERGEVSISAGLGQAGAVLDRPHVYLEVRDTGVGLPPEKLGRIFDSFWQADATTTRRFGGTGLGTTISRELVRLMGGVIGVESEQGRGSRFWVRLPLLAEQFRPSSASAPPPPVRRTALVYEPNASSLGAITEACAAIGIGCLAFQGLGQLGSLAAREQEADLAIIADSPGGEDLAGLRALLDRALGRRLPILFLTYVTRGGFSAEAGEPWVNKPFCGALLQQRIESLLDGPARAVEPTSASRPQPQTEGDGLEILVAEDNAIAAKVILALLKQDGHRVTLTKDGEETLRQVRARRFDLAFVDLRMPRIDGLDFTRALRAEEQEGRHLPVVALTANAAEDVRKEALEAGMDEFLAKPVEREALALLLNRYRPQTAPG